MLLFDWRSMILVVLPAVLLGCGSGDVVPVRGKVTYDGQPVPDVIVQFKPQEGRASEATTQADGSFEMSYLVNKMGVEKDNHKVRVYWVSPSDDGSVKPSALVKKVLDDFKAKGPIEVTVDKAESNFEIKLPR